MGIMACSLVWVMQDLCHQPYFGSLLTRGCEGRVPSARRSHGTPRKAPEIILTSGPRGGGLRGLGVEGFEG